MLREVVNKHVKPRISPFKATVASSAATINIGYGDFTGTSSGTGLLSLVSRQAFSRNGLVFVTQGTTNGGYATYNSASAASGTFPISILNQAGSANDGTVDGFTFGWDNTDLSICKKQRVAATQDAPRIIWGKVTGSSGALAIGGSDFGCTRTAAGSYTITFKRAFGRTPCVMITGSGNTSTSVANRATVSGQTAAGCTVVMAPESQTPTDGDFYICAIGTDSRSDSARGRLPLENSQRKPRIVAGQVTMASGTPSISIGGATGGADLTTLVDIGTGNFSVVIAESFIREPAIFLTTTTQSAEVKSYSAGVIDIKTKAANGNDTDVDGVTNIFIIGSDDATEY